ncbi:rRNA processing protein [Toxoplasma gondii RUB]|uniref:rRNA processing protein n=1 Tax=Toxoplasma gondii RUB TaxID=935652 RepID=A0A086LSZ6_TOXGO|nr:rRNA processing protein [Toxoplasma gondii RUB]
MNQGSGAEGGGRKGRRGEHEQVRRQQKAKAVTKKHRKRVWVNYKDKTQGWKKFKKVQDVKARAALWKLRRREDRNAQFDEEPGDAERTLTRASDDPDAFLQQLLDPLHAIRKRKKNALPDEGSDAVHEQKTARARGEKSTERMDGNAARSGAEASRSRHSDDEGNSEEDAEESEEDSGRDDPEEEDESSGEGVRRRGTKRGFGDAQREQREPLHAERRKKRCASESLESNEDEKTDFSLSNSVSSSQAGLPRKHRGSLRGCGGSSAKDEEEAEEKEGKERASPQSFRASESGQRKATAQERHGSSSAVFYPFKKAMEEAARRKAEQDARRKKAEEERVKREEERKIMEARRRQERKKLRARTKKGQPIMGNVMQVLLGKIRRREGFSS